MSLRHPGNWVDSATSLCDISTVLDNLQVQMIYYLLITYVIIDVLLLFIEMTPRPSQSDMHDRCNLRCKFPGFQRNTPIPNFACPKVCTQPSARHDKYESRNMHIRVFVLLKQRLPSGFLCVTVIVIANINKC